MIRHFDRVLAAALMALAAASPALAGTHEPLRTTNKFKTPEEVVGYYCGRDASGFVFTGLMDTERRAFTTWNTAPSQDSFLVAKGYKVGPAVFPGKTQDKAEVQVTYDVLGVSDVHGTWIPSSSRELKVTFGLQWTQEGWKIAHPLPEGISPIVVQGRFPASVPSSN